MRRILAIVLVSMVCCVSGCGLIGHAGSETEYEKKIPAEYKLRTKKTKDVKVLVLVKEPGWLGAETNLRYYLTTEMNRRLVKKVKVAAENVVSYEQIAEFRAEHPDSSRLWPAELGKAFKVDKVLLIRISGFELGRISDTGFFKGALSGNAAVVDVATARQVWPKENKSKIIRVGFEIEQKGREAAITRLAKATAHCTTRYFYDCIKANFNVPDDQSQITDQDWGENWKFKGF